MGKRVQVHGPIRTDYGLIFFFKKKSWLYRIFGPSRIIRELCGFGMRDSQIGLQTRNYQLSSIQTQLILKVQSKISLHLCWKFIWLC